MTTIYGTGTVLHGSIKIVEKFCITELISLVSVTMIQKFKCSKQFVVTDFLYTQRSVLALELSSNKPSAKLAYSADTSSELIPLIYIYTVIA